MLYGFVAVAVAGLLREVLADKCRTDLEADFVNLGLCWRDDINDLDRQWWQIPLLALLVHYYIFFKVRE